MTKTEYDGILKSCENVPELTDVLWIAKGGNLLVLTGANGFIKTIPVKDISVIRPLVHKLRFGTYVEVRGTVRDAKELADYTGTDHKFIMRLVEEGVIKPVRRGSKGLAWQFDDTAVDALIEYMNNHQ